MHKILFGQTEETLNAFSWNFSPTSLCYALSHRFIYVKFPEISASWVRKQKAAASLIGLIRCPSVTDRD
jgi:hypothetical protein